MADKSPLQGLTPSGSEVRNSETTLALPRGDIRPFSRQPANHNASNRLPIAAARFSLTCFLSAICDQNFRRFEPAVSSRHGGCNILSRMSFSAAGMAANLNHEGRRLPTVWNRWWAQFHGQDWKQGFVFQLRDATPCFVPTTVRRMGEDGFYFQWTVGRFDTDGCTTTSGSCLGQKDALWLGWVLRLACPGRGIFLRAVRSKVSRHSVADRQEMAVYDGWQPNLS